MKSNDNDTSRQPIIINNNIQNVNTNDNSHNYANNKNKSRGSLFIIIIGFIASVITIYLFVKDEIDDFFWSDYNPNVQQVD